MAYRSQSFYEYEEEEAPSYNNNVAAPRFARAPLVSLMPPPAFGNKRALLCGISYRATHGLKAPVNNALLMKNLLIQKFGFRDSSIRLLTDNQGNKISQPTKANILKAMEWLVGNCKPGDSLVFYFSGLGARVRDNNNDELDGFDEAICPVDYEDEGKIRDDDINARIVRPLPCGAKLHAIIDTNFSGTVLDLPFMCRMTSDGRYGWEDQRHPNATSKDTSGGLAVCISACDDDGRSGRKGRGKKTTGPLTSSFMEAVQNGRELSYGRLIQDMRSICRRNMGALGQHGHEELPAEAWCQYANEPQLSSSEKFDVYSKVVVI